MINHLILLIAEHDDTGSMIIKCTFCVMLLGVQPRSSVVGAHRYSQACAWRRAAVTPGDTLMEEIPRLHPPADITLLPESAPAAYTTAARCLVAAVTVSPPTSRIPSFFDI